MHTGHHAARRRIIGALMDGGEAAEKRAGKLALCGRHPVICQDVESGELVGSQARCKARICPTCAKIRANKAARRIREALKEADDPRFLTLTLKGSDDPLADQIRHLRESFARLRRAKEWKQHVRGGVYTVEVKWGKSRGQWHPHLHCIIDGTYWQQQAISKAWETASRGSSIVDIRRVHGAEALSRYITKYIAKSSDTDGMPAARLVEWSESVHGLRMLQTFGTLHGHDRDPREPAEPRQFEHVVYIGALQCGKANGDQRASRLLRITDVLISGRVPDGDEAAARRRLQRHQAHARRLRAWWRNVKESHSVYRPSNPRAHAPSHRSDDRGLWLWEEPEHPPDSVFAGFT